MNLIHGKVDLLILSETKVNDSFTTNQFLIEGFSPPLPLSHTFRKDRDAHGGGLFIYVREDIPSNLLKPQTLPENIEAIFIELNLKNNKWLLIGGYNLGGYRTLMKFHSDMIYLMPFSYVFSQSQPMMNSKIYI